MTPLIIVCCYLVLLLGLGVWTGRRFSGTARDYFVASNTIGPFLLLMSVFGTTMTGFALVGSTGKAFERGIGTYGLMASISGLVHAAIFFLIGVKLWTHGKRHGFVTQIQFFRARFDSNGLGYALFPILVGLVIPYLLIGVLAAGKFVQPLTAGAFPDTFTHPSPAFNGGIPVWLSGLVVSSVVLVYVFMGGSRGTVWANTFQTLVFMVMGLLAFVMISTSLGGPSAATASVLQIDAEGQAIQTHGFKDGRMVEHERPRVLGRVKGGLSAEQKASIAESGNLKPHLMRTPIEVEYDMVDPATKKKTGKTFVREHGVPPLMFLTYMFIPLSVGMFPHLFQNWLTAKSAKTFRLTVVAHPIFIAVVWTPCVLIGVWASGVLPALPPPAINATLGRMVSTLTASPFIAGLVGAGVLAAIMSSLDSQFLCIGTIFTNDIVLHKTGKDRFGDRQIVLLSRGFIVGIVVVTYVLAMLANSGGVNVFDLAVWCFSGFGALFPLVFAALYWRRATKAGAFASIIAAMGAWLYFFAQTFHYAGPPGKQRLAFGGEVTIGDGIMPAAFCFAASAIAMVVVSLATAPPPAETVEKFFGKQPAAA